MTDQQKKGVEFFPTPMDLAEMLFDRLMWVVPDEIFHRQDESGEPVPIQVLEPSAGTGNFARAMAARDMSVTAIDPNFDDPGIEGVDWGRMSLEELHAELDGERPFDIASGNPPFSLAEAHLRILLKMVRFGGYIGFLLRLGFLSSKGRARFFAAFPPRHVYILSSRPSFMWSYKCKVEEGDMFPASGCGHHWFCEPGTEQEACPECGNKNISRGKTDQYDYGFVIWQVGMDPAAQTTMSWINTQGEEVDAENTTD